MSNTKKSNLEPRKADAQYKPFPSFSDWLEKCTVDTVRWDRYSERLKQIKENSQVDEIQVRKAIEIATAVDTGAIEGLYETDRGFTYSVAFESAVWQTEVEDKKGEKVRALIEAQLDAFEYVLDFATKNVPIASAWIRELHKEICKEQETYHAVTEVGIQNLDLPKGKYKSLPNHVRKQNDEIHSYAPVDLTPHEMSRLCDELNNKEFQSAHPVLQAAYAHYAFVVIHPFADGNGRVSRALASIYTYRSLSIPLLIFADNRERYFLALENADNGNYQSFVDFILDVGLSSIQLFSDSLDSNNGVKVENLYEEIERLYVTKGGYSDEEVDKAGSLLVDSFIKELNSQNNAMSYPQYIKPQIQTFTVETVHENGYRSPFGGERGFGFALSTPQPPAKAVVGHFYSLEVPKDCGQNDDIMIVKVNGDKTFAARASELIPIPTSALQMRIKLFVRKIINNTLNELTQKAKENLDR